MSTVEVTKVKQRMLERLQSQQDLHHDSTFSSTRRSTSPVIVRSSNELYRTEEPRGLVRDISCLNVSKSCLPASNEDDSALESNNSCLSAAGRSKLNQFLPTEQKTTRCGGSISEDPVEATCSLESRQCTPDVTARDFADELDEHDMVGIHMVGIQIVGENMRGRLAGKHRMLALQLSQSSFRYALARLPIAVLKHGIAWAS
jgi:hypothetical protein